MSPTLIRLLQTLHLEAAMSQLASSDSRAGEGLQIEAQHPVHFDVRATPRPVEMMAADERLQYLALSFVSRRG